MNYKYIGKNILDRFMSLILIVVLFPLFILISIFVLIFLGRPILFKQARVGLNNKIFHIYKFRSMRTLNSAEGKLLDDNLRVTKFGSLLRNSSLDELPELFNIFFGSMSFVGPRPLLSKYNKLFNSYQNQRHNLKPGLTGLAQISGRNSLNWDEKFKFDVHYVNNVSFILDVKIIFKTFIQVFFKSMNKENDNQFSDEFKGDVPVLGNDLISVIVPVYNIDKYVEKCIVSILNQSYKNLEIIIVNDGSTDNSKMIIDNYSEKDKRIIVINQKNSGLVSARKIGLMSASGKYISYIDGDDYVEENFIINLYSSIYNDKSDVAIGGFKRELSNRRVTFKNNFNSGLFTKKYLFSKKYKKVINFNKYFEFGIYTYLWNKLFLKDFLITFQMKVPNEITIGEDSAVVYPLLFNASKISIIESSDYIYRQHPNSMLKKEIKFEKEILGFKMLYNYMTDALKQYYQIKSIKSQIDKLLVSLIVVRFGGYLDSNDENVFDLFDKISQKKVKLFSAGTFGLNIFNSITKFKKIEIINWYDFDYSIYQSQGLNISNPNDIELLEDETLIICSLSKKYSLLIKEFLIQKNIDVNNIYYLYKYDFNEDNILKYFGD